MPTVAPPREVSPVSLLEPDAGVIEDARRRQRRQWRNAAAAALLAAAVGLAGFALAGGGGTARVLARSRPPEPLPRLTGPSPASPVRLTIVANGYGPGPFVLNVDSRTVTAVSGLGVPRAVTQSAANGPRVELVGSTAGGVVALVRDQSCQRCVLRQSEYLIAADGSATRIVALPPITVGATGTIWTTPVRGRTAAIWLLRWPRRGPCSLQLLPSARPAVRVPCGTITAQTQAGVWIGTAWNEVIVNPATGAVTARIALTPPPYTATGTGDEIFALHGDLALENAGPHGGGVSGTDWGTLSLVNLTSGQRHKLPWPSYFGDIIRVVPEPHGPLVAVDFGSPAYPGPQQAEDIWMLNTKTGSFTHLPAYPAQVDIKFSNVAWTSDDRLVIVAQGGGRTVVGVWKPGQTTLPIRTVPNHLGGYYSSIPLVGS